MVSTVERVLLSAGAAITFEQLVECHDEENLEMQVIQFAKTLKDYTHVCRLDETDNRLACLVYSLTFDDQELTLLDHNMQSSILGCCPACLLSYIRARTQLLRSLELSYDAESVEDFVKILQEHELLRISNAVQNKIQTRHIDLLCIPPSWLSVPESATNEDVALKAIHIITAYLKHSNNVYEDADAILKLNISANVKLILSKFLMCQLMNPLTAKFARFYICLCPPTLWQKEEGNSSWREAFISLIASYLNTQPPLEDIKLTLQALITILQLQILRLDSPITNLLITNVLQIINQSFSPKTDEDILLISVFLRATACEHKFWLDSSV